MTPDALLSRLRLSPWAPWLHEARVALVDGDPWLVALDRVMPWQGEPVDAVIEAHEGTWSMRLGDRAGPERRKQAHGVLILAALDAIEDLPLVRDALWELEVGPADELVPLFAAGAPGGLDRVMLRLTDGALRTGVTCGLAELIGAELIVRAPQVPLRTLRVLALDAVEQGRVAASLVWGDRVLHTTSRAVPLPRGWCRLHTVAA